MQCFKMGKNNSLYWIGIFGVIAILFGGNQFFSIGPTKDTIAIPGSFVIENSMSQVEGKRGLAYLTFKISGDSRYYGGCVPWAPGDRAKICQSYEYKDMGCGWNTETACSCRTNELGCFGVIEYYPSNVRLSCSNIPIPFNCSSSGDCKTEDFSSLFPSPIPEGWSMKCSFTCDSLGQATRVMLFHSMASLCLPIYDDCSEWSGCINGYQSQTCLQSTNCVGVESQMVYTKECDLDGPITTPGEGGDEGFSFPSLFGERLNNPWAILVVVGMIMVVMAIILKRRK